MIAKKVYTRDNSGNVIYENGQPKLTLNKLTANQYAKEELFGALEAAFHFDESSDVSGMTENEIEKIKEQMEKRMQGIRKYLGL